ncbi:MAG: 50S ribosomal protein L3, partial [Patescibacteria group bacterium]
KAKGFQGVVKRHGFAGGPASHGHKHNLRAPGSIGSTWPQRVIKGMRMAGRMGGEAVSVRNLKIIKIDEENKLIAVSGAIPGRNGVLVEIVGMK